MENTRYVNPYEKGTHMAETQETEVIAEALSVIDKALAEILHRELVSSGEVADLLLDVRSLLKSSAAATTGA
jgi:hypothetical protein